MLCAIWAHVAPPNFASLPPKLSSIMRVDSYQRSEYLRKLCPNEKGTLFLVRENVTVKVNRTYWSKVVIAYVQRWTIPFL